MSSYITHVHSYVCSYVLILTHVKGEKCVKTKYHVTQHINEVKIVTKLMLENFDIPVCNHLLKKYKL